MTFIYLANYVFLNIFKIKSVNHGISNHVQYTNPCVLIAAVIETDIG